MTMTSIDAVSAMIAAIVLSATAGDVLIASAMRSAPLGDAKGIWKKVFAVLGNGRLVGGVGCMAISFFSLLFALSHADVSLIAPAAGSLTFVTNAIAAKIFLQENVDRKRWLAAVFVCCGVALLYA